MKMVCAIFPSDRLKTLKMSFIATFILGFVAHGYAFFNSLFSHDGLVICADVGEEMWKVTLGRFLVPFYRMFRGNIESPLLIGTLSLIYISLSVYFCCRLFKIERLRTIIAISAVFTVNTTVIAQTATYLYELDFDMLALLFAVIAAYCWSLDGKYCFLCPVFVFLSLGIYQSYICVTIILIMIYSIIEFAKNYNANTKRIVINGLKGIAEILLGGVLYAVCLFAVGQLFNTSFESGLHNSLTNLTFQKNDLFGMIVEMYLYVGEILVLFWHADLQFMFFGYDLTIIITIIRLFLILLIPAIPAFLLIKKRIKPINFVFIYLLYALLPAGMNIIYILDNRHVHSLMLFSFWLAWLIPVFFMELTEFNECFKKSAKTIIKSICCTCLAIVIFMNIRTSNAVYLKKDLEKDVTLSTMTDISRLMYDTDGYIAGRTEVMFVGKYSASSPEFDNLVAIVGCSNKLATTHSASYTNYFKLVLNKPIAVKEFDKKILEKEEVKNMPCYPDRKCVGFVDDILIVKLGE